MVVSEGFQFKNPYMPVASHRVVLKNAQLVMPIFILYINIWLMCIYVSAFIHKQ